MKMRLIFANKIQEGRKTVVCVVVLTNIDNCSAYATGYLHICNVGLLWLNDQTVRVNTENFTSY